MGDLGVVYPLGPVEVPDRSRRQLLNLLAFGAVIGVALGALYPVGRSITATG
jgi:hypothetical protein